VTFTEQLNQHAARHPDRIALICEDQQLSWRELLQEINRDQSQNSNLHSALTALARMQAGLPIVGATSGSTGAAKRYQRSQQSWLSSFESDAQEFGISSEDVVMAPGALTHSLFLYALFHGLYRGACVILADQFRPDRIFSQMARHGVTVLYGVPTHLKMLIQAHANLASVRDRAGAVFPSVRWVLSSGAKWFDEITPPLQQMFPQATVAEFYGASELSFVSVAKHGLDPFLPKGSVGKPFHGVKVAILNANQQPCAAGETGRIFVSSGGLFEMYLGPAPSDFSEITRGDTLERWCSIGDLGWRDDKGYLFLSGRESRKIISSGKNIYPEEIEQVLQTHPLIQSAAVIGVADPLRGERLAAVICAEPLSLSRPALIKFLRGQMPEFKIPRRYFLVDQWPLTPSGKTDFAAITQALSQGNLIPL
jgi:long-chain acyl-CoA synthetase